jgi:hypothetical protein
MSTEADDWELGIENKRLFNKVERLLAEAARLTAERDAALAEAAALREALRQLDEMAAERTGELVDAVHRAFDGMGRGAPSVPTPDERPWPEDEYIAAQWRKLPVVIEARRIAAPFAVMTLEGEMHGRAGDWCITGIKGEKYPCADAIFRATYEYAGPSVVAKEPSR